jgi:hypothetical protein
MGEKSTPSTPPITHSHPTDIILTSIDKKTLSPVMEMLIKDFFLETVNHYPAFCYRK